MRLLDYANRSAVGGLDTRSHEFRRGTFLAAKMSVNSPWWTANPTVIDAAVDMVKEAPLDARAALHVKPWFLAYRFCIEVRRASGTIPSAARPRSHQS